MSIYQPLADLLAGRKGDRWDASFTDIEAVLGRPLPRSAYRHQAWWANQNGAGHSQTYGWRSAGWRTARLDLERQRVTFERDRQSSPPATRPAPTDDAVDSLIATASTLTGIADREQLIAVALRALIAREAARGFAGLGGSMPDYRAPERERS